MSATVAIIGAGPAGLAAAIELRQRGVPEVVVLERERTPGGIPRHAAHQGFGLRDAHRMMSGPAYARRCAALARAAGAQLRTQTMVTGWTPDGALELTSPGGRETLRADAVLLATGCRERPRSARLVPGSRPTGVYTTGTLQQLVYLNRATVGERALIVGAEHVSFSAIATLAHGGARAEYMTTELDHHQSLALFRAGAAIRYRTRLLTRTRVAAIHGSSRVEEVEVVNLDSGAIRSIACDTVVFTADWIPDHELAVAGGIELDSQTRGPAVDAEFHTSRAGVFAAGNVLRGAETADLAALEGRHAAIHVSRYLEDPAWTQTRLPITCQTPLGWICPNVCTTRLAGDEGRYALRARTFFRRPQIVISQSERPLWRGQPMRLQPGRSAVIADGWARAVDPSGGPITVALA